MIDETDPAVALQAAMFAACTNSAALQAIAGGVRVFDRVSVSVFPFVRIGEDLVSPDDSACGSVSEVFSTVRAYSRRPGLVEVKQIAAVLQDLLDMRTGDLDVDGFRLVVGNCEGVSFERHADGLTTQAIVNFRYRLAPVATSRDYAAAGELGELVGAASAAVKIKATASATLGELTGSASAVVFISASGDVTLGELTGSASAAVKIKATASATLGELVGAASAVAPIKATSAATLGELTGAASASIAIKATASATLGELVGAASAVVPIKATAAGTLGELTGAASAAVKIKATASATLGELTGAASAVVQIKATAAATLGELVGAAAIAGQPAAELVGEGALGELTGSASAAVKIKATASATLGELVGAALASITTPATAAAPSVVWAAFTEGGGSYDMSAQDVAEGDVIMMVTIGSYINTTTYGNHSVQYYGWTLIYTNGSSSNATTLSYRIVDAAYLLALNGATSGNSVAKQMIWCVRGADLAQFAATDMGGYLEIADATVSTYGNTGTSIDTATGTVDDPDSLIFSLGVSRRRYFAKTAPAGYTIVAQGTENAKSIHMASKAGPAVGTENPGPWSGGSTGTFRGYTLVIAPL
jgi:hypothetical protein